MIRYYIIKQKQTNPKTKKQNTGDIYLEPSAAF